MFAVGGAAPAGRFALMLLAFASCVQCQAIGSVGCRRSLASVIVPVRLRTVVDAATPVCGLGPVEIVSRRAD